MRVCQCRSISGCLWTGLNGGHRGLPHRLTKTPSNDLVTSFGKLTTWDFAEVFTLDWWLNQPSEGWFTEIGLNPTKCLGSMMIDAELLSSWPRIATAGYFHSA